MKRLLCYIVCFLCLFNSGVKANDIVDLNSKNQILQKIIDEGTSQGHNSFDEVLMKFNKIAVFINENYSLNEISSTDFLMTLKQIFPNDDEDDLIKKQKLILGSYAAYQKTTELYNKIINYKLMPKTTRIVHSYDDYDHDDEVEYKQAPKGSFYLVKNFKKFLTYSSNTDEIKAISAYEKKINNISDFNNMAEDIFQQIEWRKLPYYGYKYENPLLSKYGIGSWQESPYVKLRLLSRKTSLTDDAELDFGVQIITQPNYFVLANNISTQYQKPHIDLAQSENLKSFDVIYPMPLNATNLPEAHKYFGNFLIPLKVKPEDKQKPLLLKGQINLSMCDSSLICKNEEFPLDLRIPTHDKDYGDNGYDNYFYTALKALPNQNSKYITLQKSYILEEQGRPIIHLQFKTTKNVKSFKVFIEKLNDFVKFKDPLVSLHDNKIYVNIEPNEDNTNTVLDDSEYIISATLNNMYSIRQTKTLKKASIFTPDNQALNVNIILLAILGGFILNFMPCVFPVLAFKISAFSHAQTKKIKHLRSSLIITIYGIFCGFSILIAGLCLTKFLGYSLGWGMQFQHMGFLVVMTFILAAFITLMPAINFNSLSGYTASNPNNKITFFTGNLIVLLSTPCTAPFLATAIGFALSSTYANLIVCLYAVSLGLSLPYILILLLKDPENFFPKPGKWMINLQHLANIMLYLSIIWLLILIWEQTNWKIPLIMLFLLVFFAWTFHIYLKFLEYLHSVSKRNITPQLLKKIRLSAHLIVLAIFIIINIICFISANRSYQQNKLENIAQKQTQINETLINKKLNEGKSVLIEIGADWCLTCQANKFLLFNEHNIKYWQENFNLEYIQIDWTDYNREILDYMGRYSRKGIPFYILYTPFMREGIVLPENFNNTYLSNLLLNSLNR